MTRDENPRSAALHLLTQLSELCGRPGFSSDLVEEEKAGEMAPEVAEVAQTFLRLALRPHPTFDDREPILEAANVLARRLDVVEAEEVRSVPMSPVASMIAAYASMWSAMFSFDGLSMDRERREALTRILRLVPFDYAHCNFPTTYFKNMDSEHAHPALAMRRMWDFLIWREGKAQENVAELHAMMAEYAAHRSAAKLADRVTGRYGRLFHEGHESLEDKVEREIGRRLLPDERTFLERFAPYTDIIQIIS